MPSNSTPKGLTSKLLKLATEAKQKNQDYIINSSAQI